MLDRTERKEMMNEMIAAKVKSSTIAKTLDYNIAHVSRQKAKILKNPLLTNKLIKQSIKNVQYFNVDNYINDKRIKPSDVLHASEIILDRAFPKTQIVKSETMNIDITLDLNEYRNLTEKTTTEHKIIDVSSPHIVVENTEKDKSL